MNVMPLKPIDGRTSRDILGVDVDAVSWEQALAHILHLVEKKRPRKITFLNAHNANVACRDPEFSRIIKDFLILPDGVGVDYASRILYGEKFPANLNGTDFVPAVFASIETPLTVALLGARRENVDKAGLRLSQTYPQHHFIVISDGYFSQSDEPAILDELEKTKPDILLVAMGVPRQEKWIARNIGEKHATLTFAVGALLDFQSGAINRAPMWMRALRIEWVYRLLVEPSRMWRRYILGNPEFFLRVLRQKLGR